jgi:hypothetical protein
LSAPGKGNPTATTSSGVASLDDDHLQAARLARRRDEPEPGKQLERVRVEVAGERQVA